MAKKASAKAVGDTLADSMRRKDVTTVITGRDLLHFGSTVMNLCSSGKPQGGILAGDYILFTGDSGTAKTWEILGIMAEALRTQRFGHYRMIYDGKEGGAKMNITKYFGARLAAKLEPPKRDAAGMAQPSETIEELYYNIDDAVSAGPCIYAVDSMDSLDSAASVKKYRERKAAHGTAKKVAGDYGDGKAKHNSTHMRQMLTKLKKSGSILIIVAQTRDNIDPDSFDDQVRAGGRALKFYADIEIWFKRMRIIAREINGTRRRVGMELQCTFKKNRLTGREWVITVPFLDDYGIDDVGGCIDFICQEKHWARTMGADGKPGITSVITAPEFEFSGQRATLIKKIEEGGQDMERKLRMLTSHVWDDMVAKLDHKRKPRYE